MGLFYTDCTGKHMIQACRTLLKDGPSSAVLEGTQERVTTRL